MAALASGCVWGVVRDADTGAGLTGATITYTDAHGASASTTTGPLGLYAFNLAGGHVPALGDATFDLSKDEFPAADGYATHPIQ